MTIQGSAKIAKRAPQGRPGSACSRSATRLTAAVRHSAVRGRNRSEADTRNHDAINRINGPPEIARPLAIGFLVAA